MRSAISRLFSRLGAWLGAPRLAALFGPAQQGSIIRRALLGCTVTLVAFMVVTALVSFLVGYEAARERQDRVLKEVVGILSRDIVHQRYRDQIEQLTRGGFYGPGSTLGESVEASNAEVLTMDDSTFEDSFELDDDNPSAVVNAGETVLVRMLHKRGRAMSVTFSESYWDGAHTVEIFGEKYRIFLRTLSDGTHVAAGQLLTERNRAILFGALTSAAPILVLAPVMLLVLLLVLWRALRPLKNVAGELESRRAEDLKPIDGRGAPLEVRHLVEAVNGLLERVSELRRREARFVADAAHELRSPMTALSLQVDRLSQMKLAPEVRERVEDIKAAIARTTNLVTQLLALKRAQAQGETPAAPACAGCLKVISSVAADLYWAAEERQQALNVEGLESAEGAQLAVAMPESDFAALVRNLVQNAVNYTPRGGSVQVCVRAGETVVELEVSDTGPGIAPAERERVFDPFYRILGSEAQGTGLGLAICKTVVECASGTIALDWAHPEAPEGSRGLRVTVRLPRAQPGAGR